VPQTTRSALPLLPLGSAAYMREASLKKGDSRLKELYELLNHRFRGLRWLLDYVFILIVF